MRISAAVELLQKQNGERRQVKPTSVAYVSSADGGSVVYMDGVIVLVLLHHSEIGTSDWSEQCAHGHHVQNESHYDPDDASPIVA